MSYLIIQCYHCGQYIMAKRTKTRQCPFCGKIVEVRKSKILLQAKDARTASFALRSIREAHFIKQNPTSFEVEAKKPNSQIPC